MSDDKKNEELSDLITLVDEEGKTHSFELLDAIETDDGRFVALLPVGGEEPVSEEIEEYYILQVTGSGDDEELAEIEDDELLDGLAEIFEERFNEIFAEEE